MIRIQMACLTCGQIIDGTFAARSVIGIVSAYDAAHLYEACRKEDLDGGAQEAESAAGSDSGDTSGQEAGADARSKGPIQ
jgi:hypothetical protein